MLKSSYCGEELTLHFKHNFCGQDFCEEHRLAENYDCPNAPARIPLGSHQTRQTYEDRERAMKVKYLINITYEGSHGLFDGGAMARTYEGKYHFEVPLEVYANEEYHKKLNDARTLNEVERIVHDCYKLHPKGSTNFPSDEF